MILRRHLPPPFLLESFKIADLKSSCPKRFSKLQPILPERCAWLGYVSFPPPCTAKARREKNKSALTW